MIAALPAPLERLIATLPKVELAVVNLRQELGPWYRSQGYREVGTAPFDLRPAKQACHFVRMQKALA